MGLIDKISEVAKHSEHSNKNKEDAKASGTPNTTEKPNEMSIINSVQSPTQTQPSTQPSTQTKPSKSMKDRLKKQGSIEVKREATGLEGGLSSASDVNKSVKPSMAKTSDVPTDDPTSLINKEATVKKTNPQGELAGGLENKTSSSDINSGKVKGIVTDFAVSGGIGTDTGTDITKHKHGDGKKGKPEEEKHKIKKATNAGRTEEGSNLKALKTTKSRHEHSHDHPPTPYPTDQPTKQPTDQPKTTVETKVDQKPVNGGVERTTEITHRTETEEKAPIKPSEVVGAGLVGAGVAGAGTTANPNPNPNQNTAPVAGKAAATSTFSEWRRFEEKPEVSSNSYLYIDRANSDVLYESSASKRRYFIQFLWTTRHFTISKNGILKYYRNPNGKRRGEFDLKKDFTDMSTYETTGKYPYRITLASSKDDDLGFETAEKRDEFFHWLESATQDN
ncbi:hypothetical protein NEDG_01704 [Nematocida displodere]|uniref:PH domain-containing protein n=1 Tax=Nematocida displodere TaxID=1805483 RepID=A0A177EF54_9MICR|nr:hypothetical protein NEDG_01704 [Nematocida displodere]